AAIWANWADPLHIDTLVVTDPEYLLFLPDAQAAGVTVGRVIVLLDQPVPHVVGGTSLPPLDWAEQRVLQRFGVRAEWASCAPGIVAALRSDDRALVAHPFAVSDRPTLRAPELRSRPTVGLALPAPADKALP